PTAWEKKILQFMYQGATINNSTLIRERQIERMEKLGILRDEFHVMVDALIDLAGAIEPAKKVSISEKQETDILQPLENVPESGKSSEMEARIKELRGELANPPKSPLIGLKMWKAIRENELNNLLGM